MPLLSIIVPVYNEEKILEQSLPPIFNLPTAKQVIVINDGSTDNSIIKLQNLSNIYNFDLINLSYNQGKGSAIRQAIKYVRGKYFIICDADLEYDPKEILKLLNYAVKQNQPNTIIYGTRFIDYQGFHIFYLANIFLTFLTNLLFKSKLTDMETCFKLIPTQALWQLKLTARRFEIEPQITAQLLKKGYRIIELSISYNRRSSKQGKKIKFSDGLIAIWTLLKERFNS